ncbi:probable inactive leucine-rich repeat receptor-like protein kinase At3g03770 [Rosa chinensis]|uniref:probable inactive leucine-rich repeat receptor-like protein kinase At3g03770 n=1 Tax=Rosa chinensis TaxID=74649 RepID=UPI000D096AA8|nr:probable inactive leucine-rich repeat receptor-like protein kinase At3g03770 [Rosa chinensis]
MIQFDVNLTENYRRFDFDDNMQLYKGRLKNGIQVVIRCLLVSKKYTIRNLKLSGWILLAKLRHPYLGHCLDGGGDDYSVNKVYLVSEYVANGTFRAKLSGRPEKVFNWPQRLSVLIGVTKAVQCALPTYWNYSRFLEQPAEDEQHLAQFQ